MGSRRILEEVYRVLAPDVGPAKYQKAGGRVRFERKKVQIWLCVRLATEMRARRTGRPLDVGGVL